MTDKKKIEKKINKIKENFHGLAGKSIQGSSKNESALKLCDTVLEYVPEFKEYKEFSVWEDNGKENPYMHFGNFGRFLVEQIEKSPNSTIVIKSFDFINRAYNDIDSDYVRTMLGTEIFENLMVSKDIKTVASNNLKGDALMNFKKVE